MGYPVAEPIRAQHPIIISTQLCLYSSQLPKRSNSTPHSPTRHSSSPPHTIASSTPAHPLAKPLIPQSVLKTLFRRAASSPSQIVRSFSFATPRTAPKNAPSKRVMCDTDFWLLTYHELISQGPSRLLLFSSDTLYFTTALSHSVQVYSLTTGAMLPSQLSHPSPPNVIASSSTGDIILSASPAPPTIYLQYRRCEDSAPMRFQPTDTLTPVTCATFARKGQGDKKYVYFVLGFMDGMVALYRTHPSPTRCRMQPVKMGVVKRLHKPGMRGVKAVEFIPGYTSRVVSVSLDGRCRLVDLGRAAKVYRTWNVEGEAHCLAVQKLIAIGTSAGKVEIYNVISLKVREIDMNRLVIRVEWVGDTSDTDETTWGHGDTSICTNNTKGNHKDV
jgi:hypothetical protein